MFVRAYIADVVTVAAISEVFLAIDLKKRRL
jgi:hypothetical protein